MSSATSINVVVSADGSKAVLPLLAAENAGGVSTDMDLVLAALRVDNVVAHIDKDAIASAIERATVTQQAVTDVVAAIARLEHEFRFFNYENGIDTRKLTEEIKNARMVYRLLSGDPEAEPTPACWCETGKLLYEVLHADAENIFGQRITKKALPFGLGVGKNVVNDKTPTGFRYISDSPGFLTLDDSDIMHLVSPFVVSEDKMLIWLRLVPLKDKAMVDAVAKEVSRLYALVVLPQCQEMSLEEVLARTQEFYNSDEDFLELVVARGRDVVPGEPGRIEYLVNLNGRPLDIDAQQVDYGDYTRYCMVQQGQGLVEIIRPVQGEAGVDVVGNVIECEVLEEPVMEVAECVDVDESGGRKLLRSTMDGCVFFEKNSVRVTDTVIISGNVGPETGSIKKGASSVVVKGNILSGYAVESENSVIIEGSVENGGRVNCRQLVVHKGVFGKKSNVYVTGNAEIGYIHGAVVRVLGNLMVYRYVMESEVTCRGQLIVQGQGASGKERGAVIGGNISVLGSVFLHSVGSGSEPTRVCCGVDAYLYNKLLVCRNIISGLNTEVVRMQRSVGFDLSSPDAVKRLKNMSVEQREVITSKLAQIKKMLVQIDQYQQQIKKVEDKALAHNMANLRLQVERHVIPRTTLAIGLAEIDITTRFSGISARLKENEVVIDPL
ncbi:MAG: DUF342 domain-containing protein [Sedimentisphaerales bacterium]|nr:DUF342 domain-containing protein [Sedimentisphaerales bacterium]MBN2844121.1 DUF342 domain-containing protein [Sedimentisphaerales bacterium]